MYVGLWPETCCQLHLGPSFGSSTTPPSDQWKNRMSRNKLQSVDTDTVTNTALLLSYSRKKWVYELFNCKQMFGQTHPYDLLYSSEENLQIMFLFCISRHNTVVCDPCICSHVWFLVASGAHGSFFRLGEPGLIHASSFHVAHISKG